MFQGLGNMAALMKQAAEMKTKLAELQQEMQRVRVTGRAGGDMVKVVMNGLGEAVEVIIDRQLIADQEVELIQTLTAAAFNDAKENAQKAYAEGMQRISPALDPGMLKDLMGRFSG